MKIDKIVHIKGKGHVICVRNFDEHVFNVGDKVILSSSEEIGLEKTMFIAQITAVERIGMTVPYYLGLIIHNPDNINLSKYNELQY